MVTDSFDYTMTTTDNLLQAADVVVGGTAVAVAGPAMATTGTLAVLQSLGWTALGPAAGSYAAGLMSTTAAANGGGVVAGSLYAMAQSFAMTGCWFSPWGAVVGVGATGYFTARAIQAATTGK